MGKETNKLRDISDLEPGELMWNAIHCGSMNGWNVLAVVRPRRIRKEILRGC